MTPSGGRKALQASFIDRSLEGKRWRSITGQVSLAPLLPSRMSLRFPGHMPIPLQDGAPNIMSWTHLLSGDNCLLSLWSFSSLSKELFKVLCNNNKIYWFLLFYLVFSLFFCKIFNFNQILMFSTVAYN